MAASDFRHGQSVAERADGGNSQVQKLSARQSGLGNQTSKVIGVGSETQPEVYPLQRLMCYLSTALRLRVSNVARAAFYRVCKRMGLYRWLLPRQKSMPLRFAVQCGSGAANPLLPWANPSVLSEADELLAGKAKYFSVHSYDVGNPPIWFLNAFQNKPHSQAAFHWSEIEDFSPDAGDIKIIWELSRFSWAPIFARAWRISGDLRYTSALQDWMEDWWRCNPPNTGPNWMCGQEVSIRLVNTLLALRVLEREKYAAAGFLDFVETHCRRVDFTTSYAVAQDNNHATSEAAGLFVGGSWLARHGKGASQRRGRRWAEKGRKLLQDSVRRLVLADGSFSQHSLTYHRLMLDTLSVAEMWRQRTEERRFAEDFYSRAAAATRWLGAVIDPLSGDGPNLGANDGARPYRLDVSPYRDFRPCLQLASLVFNSGSALDAGPWDEPAAWLGVSTGSSTRPWLSGLGSEFFAGNGYVVMRNRSGAFVLLRAPTARFRPAHADALHVDLWWNGTNVLRDGGTYTYAGFDPITNILSSVISHNIIQFDNHDQMPRISRFLYGNWVRVAGSAAINTTADGQSWTGSYTDTWGAEHKRTLTLRRKSLSVKDEVQGFKANAVLRWRLAPGNWTQSETGCESSIGKIYVQSSVPIRRTSLATGWESRHYLEKSLLPVFEVEINQSPAVLTTTITFS